MKSRQAIFLTLVFLLLFFVSAHSQNLVIPKKTWVFQLASDYPNPEIYTDLRYKIGNDTLIEGIVYKNLLSSQGNDNYDRIRGFIREEENGKVYFRDNSLSHNDEYLLYDFGMEPGDTAHLGWTNSFYRLDSTGINFDGRKVFYFTESQFGNDVWIDGVGSTMGLLKEQITGGSMMFSCCLLGDEQLYHNSDFESCYFSPKKEIEWFPIGAEWYYTQTVSFNPPMGENYVKHTCIKDSIINGKLVAVIQKTKFTREGPLELGFEYLHQSGDTISFWKNGEFRELYNFSLKKGDSMLIYSDPSNYIPCDTTNSGWVTIDSVFSVTINNQQLRGYFATHKEGYFWGFDGYPIIEKIGSTHYLFPRDISCVADVIGIGPLRCYADPELGTFYNSNQPCDTLTTPPVYSPKINRNERIDIYPNPAKDKITITNTLNIKIKKVELVDLSGRTIQYWDELELRENVLQIESVIPGIYLLKIETDTGIKTEKLVVQ